ncbi:uncharacterized protein [Triticum aestivum]|uniref:uncharacterized protein n=1 Tax=Triticum aestivum TaxID=4565 RepID=UPI001D018191|nr:uncharacterized protein LOC123138871 [Triticum aestivum]
MEVLLRARGKRKIPLDELVARLALVWSILDCRPRREVTDARGHLVARLRRAKSGGQRPPSISLSLPFLSSPPPPPPCSASEAASSPTSSFLPPPLPTAPLIQPPRTPQSTLRRLLLSAAVPPRTGFAVQEYLVETCGLTEAQALKASAKLSHLKSPSKPDAVLAFLAGLGLSTADIAAVVPRDPRFLCAGVERTLAPNVLGLAGLGLSRSQIARLFSLVPGEFRRRSIVSNLPYYQSLFGSYKNLLRVLNRNNSLLGCSLDKVVKPNVAFLRECGLGDCDITKLCCKNTWILSNNP